MLLSMLSLKAAQEISAINSIYAVKFYKFKRGWGFTIFKNRKVLFKQEFELSIGNEIPYLTKGIAKKKAYEIIDNDRISSSSEI